MKYRNLTVEILDTGEFLMVQLRKGEKGISLRSYKRDERIDAINFASAVAEITKANWQIIKEAETGGREMKCWECKESVTHAYRIAYISDDRQERFRNVCESCYPQLRLTASHGAKVHRITQRQINKLAPIQ